MRYYSRPDLFIIDEFGFDRIERSECPQAAHLLYKIIAARNQKRSTALVTNVDFDQWGDYLPDGPIAMAFLDRLVEGAIILKIQRQVLPCAPPQSWRKARLTKSGGLSHDCACYTDPTAQSDCWPPFNRQNGPPFRRHRQVSTPGQKPFPISSSKSVSLEPISKASIRLTRIYRFRPGGIHHTPSGEPCPISTRNPSWRRPRLVFRRNSRASTPTGCGPAPPHVSAAQSGSRRDWRRLELRTSAKALGSRPRPSFRSTRPFVPKDRICFPVRASIACKKWLLAKRSRQSCPSLLPIVHLTVGNDIRVPYSLVDPDLFPGLGV